MTSFIKTRYVEVDGEQAGTPKYMTWLEQELESSRYQITRAIAQLDAITLPVVNDLTRCEDTLDSVIAQLRAYEESIADE